VATKYGPVKTDHVLFIASGAFSLSKPSDLIPELQGRLPIRVELDSLKVGDFVRILTEARCLAHHAVQGADGDRRPCRSSSRRMACGASPEIAFQVNERTENIGARRLHTVMERLLETVSYEAAEQNGKPDGQGSVTIDAKYVDDHLGKLVQDED